MTTASLSELIFGEKAPEVDFGVEIELEGRNLRNLYESSILPTWRIDTDGSLRNGLELILHQPIKFINLESTLRKLTSDIKREKVTIISSDRTGIHLHLNVGDLTPLQLINFLCAYYILEEAIVQTCGENRIGNHFCLRAVDADFIINKLVDSINGHSIYELKDDIIRYSALNLCSLFKYGTVEFRAIQTTPEFTSQIMNIANILYNLKMNCKRFQHPQEILHEFSGFGYKFIIEKLISYQSSRNLLLNLSNIETMCKTGMYLTQDIVYARSYNEEFNWGLVGKRKLGKSKKGLNPFLRVEHLPVMEQQWNWQRAEHVVLDDIEDNDNA